MSLLLGWVDVTLEWLWPPVGSCKANQRGKGMPGKVVSTSKGREAKIHWTVSRLTRAMTGTSRHMAPGQLMFLFIRVLCHPASSCIWGQGEGMAAGHGT